MSTSDDPPNDHHANECGSTSDALTVDQLPYDIWAAIAECLTATDAVHLSATCRSIYSLVHAIPFALEGTYLESSTAEVRAVLERWWVEPPNDKNRSTHL